MVAFNSSRRKLRRTAFQKDMAVELFDQKLHDDPLRSTVQAAASRRSGAGVEVTRDAKGQIAKVRIGRWRVVTAAPQRRIAEVRKLVGEHVAVRIERFVDVGVRPSSEIWQLYDADGRLEAALQTTPGGTFALLTNYRTRMACRLMQDANGELQTVETWNI